MKGESVFREESIRKAALDIRDQFVATMEANLVSDASNDEMKQTRDSVNRLLTFKASSQWLSNFMHRNHLIGSKGAGQNGHFTEECVEEACVALRKQLCLSSVADICNTDEVGVLYRSFPSRAIRSVDTASTYERIKDRLTVVPTVYADGRKAPLTIIGTENGPGAFQVILI